MTRHSDVFVGIASFGRRARMLEAAVESLLPQVDRIGVYLNNYPEIPSFLDHPRIVVEVSADHGDLRDNGKFFFLGKTGHRFYASADDDLVYPPDYIDVLKGCLGDAGPGSAIAVHGAVYPPRLLDMFTSRHLFHFSESLQHVMPVHLVGTGTLFFDQAEWQLSFDEFGEPGMADVWFARSAKARGARLFVVNRNRDWLRPVEAAGVAMPTESPFPTLFAEAEVGRGRQVELLTEARISEGEYGGLVDSLLQSSVFSERMTISQAIAFERLRHKLGWKPLDADAAREAARRIDAARTDWDVPELAPGERAAYSEAIAAVMTRRISSSTAENAIDALERLSSLQESDMSVWKSLPYALRFDTRADRLPTIKRELLELSVRSGPEDARSIWPRLATADEELSPRVALDLERAGVDTDFQRLPPLALVGRKNWKAAGNYLREYFEIHDWKPSLDLLAWRRIFGRQFESKQVQLLAAMTALRSGQIARARQRFATMTHRWTGDRDVGLLEAILDGADGPDVRSRLQPVLEHLDRLVSRFGLMSYLDCLGSDRDVSHWISLFESSEEPAPGGGRPDVSVVMTVHNNGDTVTAAAESILASRGVDVELLIVDDASTDTTPDALEKLDDPRVKVVRNPQNLGPYVSRNRALEMASGEFIAIADADDWSHPDRLSYQVERLNEAPEVLACTVTHIRVTPEGVPDLENHLEFFGDGPMTLMFRRDVVDQIGGFDHVRTRGDMEYLSRLRARFGEQALRAFGVPLVLSTSTPWSNSKRFPPEALDRYRAAFRDWHTVNRLSDDLYVPVSGSERARFIAPQELVVDFS